MDKNNKSIQVLNRAFEILKIIKSEKSTKMSLGKIAKLANLPRSTVQRIVNSLIKEDFLSYSTDQGIQIGNEIYKLAATDNYDIVRSLKPVINSLSNKTRETVDLAILNHDHMLLLDRVLGTYRLGVNSKIGLKLPLSTTASGKSALSLMDNNKVKDLLKNEKSTYRRTDTKKLDLKLSYIQLKDFASAENSDTEQINYGFRYDFNNFWAISDCNILYVPADPQQIWPSGIS